MAKKFQDSTGTYFNTQAEAAASNTALGTNPMASNINTGVKTDPINTTPPTIAVDDLSTTSQNLKLPNQKQPDFSDVENLIASLSSAQTNRPELQEQKEERDDSLKSYVDELLGSSKIASTIDRTAQNEAQKKVNQYTSMLEQEDLSTRRAIENLQKNNPQGLFGGALEQEVNRLNRESLSRKADIAILQTAANRDYATAADIADSQLKIKTDESRAKAEALRFFYEQNKDDFDKNEQRAYNEVVRKAEQEYEEEQSQQKSIQNIKLEAVKNGAPLSVISSLSGAKTVDDALRLSGRYLVTPSTDVVKLDNGNTVVVDSRTGKIVNNLGGSSTSGGSISPQDALQYDSLVTTVSNLEPTVAGKEAVSLQLQGLLARQDYTSAYNQVANTVAGSLTGETKTRFENARIDREVLSGLRGAIESFELAGGDTNLLKGSAEEINRKLGRVTDPALASLAVQLQREFQTYRNTMTGAAFGPKESREYASVNPTAKKNLDLNLAVIDGAINQLDNRVDGTIRAKVPQATDIKKLSQPKLNADQSRKKVNTVYSTGNQQVKSTIESLLTAGQDEQSIVEYLQMKGLIPAT